MEHSESDYIKAINYFMVNIIFRIGEKMFDQLKPLIELDPLFLYGLVYVCPKNDHNSLMYRIPLFLPIAFKAKQLEEENRKSIQIIEVCA